MIVESAPEREPSNDDEAVEQIGFPAFATRNTTRVGGVDATSTASGVALASYPSLGGVRGAAGRRPRPGRLLADRAWPRPR